MSYFTRVYRHRNAHTHDEVQRQPFFSRQHDISKCNQNNTFFQAKLIVSDPGDEFEKEADNVANAIVNNKTGTPVLQQKKISSLQMSTDAEKEERKKIQKKDDPLEEEEKKKKVTQIQAKQERTATTPSIPVSSKIESTSGKGNALPAKTLNEMGASFGVDFSNVHVHNDTEAVGMSEEINAQAFTHGNDIYFNEGKFNPESYSGKFLLAHELTHVVQQNNDGSLFQTKIQRKPGDKKLQSSRFAGDEVLERCFNGDTTAYLRFGSSGSPVEKVQQALMDLGFELPQFGADGKFGNETGKAVSKFKSDNNISPSDPVVGQKTITELDNKFSCDNRQSVNTDKDPVPPVPPFSPVILDQPELVKELRNRRPNEDIPSGALAATMPDFGDSDEKLKVTSMPVAGSSCLKCVAKWNMVSKLDTFIGSGSFVSDEPPRFAVIRSGDSTGCPETAIPHLLNVMIVIKPDAIPFLVAGEFEHFLDFVKTFNLVAARYVANVNRLTPERTHIFGSSQKDCENKVVEFLKSVQVRGNFHSGLFDFINEFRDMFVSDFNVLFSNSQKKRDATKKHSAKPFPPMDRSPLMPNIDLAINPFGCKNFVRFDNGKSFPDIPGESFEDVIRDVNIPFKQKWHVF